MELEEVLELLLLLLEMLKLDWFCFHSNLYDCDQYGCDLQVRDLRQLQLWFSHDHHGAATIHFPDGPLLPNIRPEARLRVPTQDRQGHSHLPFLSHRGGAAVSVGADLQRVAQPDRGLQDTAEQHLVQVLDRLHTDLFGVPDCRCGNCMDGLQPTV